MRFSDDLRISAVIPTYNRGRHVGRAIESVLAQTCPPSEIVVIDDGSSDDTPSIVGAYPQVRYIRQQNRGVASARNRGVREAAHEWIAFLDSDDCWAPEHLERMRSAICATHGMAALYFADLRQPMAEGGARHWSKCGLEVNAAWEMRKDAFEWALMRTQPMMLQASVLSKQVYEDLGGLPEGMRTREDTLLFFKLGFLHPVCAVAGCGTIMNADDSIRLTTVHAQHSLDYWNATISMYRELLGLENVARGHRFFKRALVGAYYTKGRLCLRKRNYRLAVRSFLGCMQVNPALFVGELVRTLARRVKR
jgi:glycosyltransferase involved in cell wall biosynthesis